MNASIRKLAFDLGFRGLIPFLILLALASDYFYLSDNQSSIAMNGGLMFALQGNSTRGKIALWRTLPVADWEIGRARWWQMVGLPGIGIIVTMGAALTLHALTTAVGWAYLPLRPGAEDILRGLLLQLCYPAFFTVLSLATIFAWTRRSPFAYLVAVAVCAPWLLLMTHTIPLPAQNRFLLLGLIGMVTAIILYVTAPSWPQPPAQPLQLDLGGGGRISTLGRPGQDGWTDLCGMALLKPLVVLIPVMSIYVAAILALNLSHILVVQLQLFIPFIVITQITRFNAAVLRVLRGLPGSAHALTAYLFLLPMALLAAITAAYCLVLEPWLKGAVPVMMDTVPLAAVLLVSALALPAAISMRQATMSILLTFTMVLVGLIEFGWSYVPSPWQDERLLAGLTLAAVAAGYILMHSRISRGTAVYRPQPLIAARWHGKD